MKKMSKAFLTLVSAAVLFGLSACSPSVDVPPATIITPTPAGDWLPVTSKNDMVGTWVANPNLLEHATLSIKQDYTGTFINAMSVSGNTNEQITSAVHTLNQVLKDGGHAVYDSSSKKIITTMPIGHDAGYGQGPTLDVIMIYTKINSTKNKLLFSYGGNSATYTKQ